LEELAILAEKVMDVAALSVAAVSTPQTTTDVEHAPLVHTPLLTPPCAGTTNVLARMPVSAERRVHGREMTRSVASGDKRSWPQTKSPILCH
jgi:hypothetical protein